MDIVIYKGDIKNTEKPIEEKYAIELKYPVNGQYPEQMYSFIKDIKFAEQLKEKRFNNAYTLTIVCQTPFYEDQGIRTQTKIYDYFKKTDNNEINGTIEKPTVKGREEKKIEVNGHYKIECQNLNGTEFHKYYILEASTNN